MNEYDLSGRKIVLFGAGNAARNLIKKFEDMDFLCFLDNDSEKWGKDIGGVKICSPTTISSLDYDLIWITTGWWQTISQQLISLGVSADKIKLPPKKFFAIHQGGQPFEHERTRMVAEQLIFLLGHFSISNDLDIFLDFGTLLGAVRDGGLIKWDDDIDMIVREDKFEKLISLAQDMKNFILINLDAEILFYKIVDEYKGGGISVTVSGDDIVPFELSILCRCLDGENYVTKGLGTEFIAPKKYFENNDLLEFLGVNFKVPFDCKDYLRYMYGDWMKPKKDMSLDEYNTQEPEFKKSFKTQL